MDIQWLKTFISTAQHENFHRAAEQLFLAQPTVSMHIKRLEEFLAISLFERKGRNVYLSQAGRRFLPYAQTILDNFETGIDDLESWRQGYKSKITIAVSPLVAAASLPLIVRKFLKHHANIEVSIDVMESVDIGGAVYHGLADIGLSCMQASQKGLQTLKLKEDPVILVAPHDGIDLESAPPMILETLLENHMVLAHNHPEYWDGLLNELQMKYPRTRTMTVSQVYITKRFIEEGLGISFLPRSTVQRELIEGRVLEVHTSEITMPMAFTYMIHQLETEEVQAFLSFITEYYYG